MPPSTTVHTAPKRTPRIASSCHAILQEYPPSTMAANRPYGGIFGAIMAGIRNWISGSSEVHNFEPESLIDQTRPCRSAPASTEARARTVLSRSFGRERKIDHHDRVLLHDTDQQDDADQRDDAQIVCLGGTPRRTGREPRMTRAKCCGFRPALFGRCRICGRRGARLCRRVRDGPLDRRWNPRA